MEFFQTLFAVVSGAALIGGSIGIAIAYKRKTDLEVLRLSNKDYKDRNEQLESDITRLKQENTVLEAQRILPFEKLTKLIVTQHKQSLESVKDMTKELGNLAKSIASKEN